MGFFANTDPITKLRFVLTANATTSGLAGLTALVTGERVDNWLDTAHAGWVRIIGAGLVAFALAVIALSRSREQDLRRWVPAVSFADGGWVAASIATIIAGWYSSSGAAIIGAHRGHRRNVRHHPDAALANPLGTRHTITEAHCSAGAPPMGTHRARATNPGPLKGFGTPVQVFAIESGGPA